MKKSSFVAMILGTVSGILFAPSFFICKRGTYGDLFNLCADGTKHFFTFTDAPLKDSNPHKAARVDIRIYGVRRYDVIDIDRFALLAAPVDSTDALLNPHGIPWKVVVDHRITELIVQSLIDLFFANIGIFLCVPASPPDRGDPF